MKPIKVFLIDDHKIYLEGLSKLIQDDPEIQVVGTATDGKKAVRQIRTLQPDIVILDISMSGNGIEGTRLIKQTGSHAKVLILSMHKNEGFIRKALESGASGYVLKDATVDELLTAIKEIDRGNVYLDPSFPRRLLSDFIRKGGERSRALESPLTARETKVLKLIAEGNSQNHIGQVLKIRLSTVQTYRKQIMRKLDLHNASELVRYAVQNGIVDISHPSGKKPAKNR